MLLLSCCPPAQWRPRCRRGGHFLSSTLRGLAVLPLNGGQDAGEEVILLAVRWNCLAEE
jgi:hypothetical protein